MRREQLEFLISQYLDGTIAPVDRSALEERLSGDAEARGMLAEYQAIDAMAKSALPLPKVDWEMLAGRISANINESSAAEAGMLSLDAQHEPVNEINEEYEFAIAQYADGTLPAEQREAFERRLAADPAARQVLESYRSIDLLAKVAMPLPAVKWDRLAERISESIEDEVAPATYSRSLKWLRSAPMLAIAASLIVGLMVMISIIMNRETGGGGGGGEGVRLAEVSGPVAEKPAGKPVAIVELIEPEGGPSFAAISSEVVSVPSRVEFARAYRVEPPRRDEGLPF